MPLSFSRIQSAILEVRGQRVLLDRDLAELYDVKTKALNQAVARNRSRFPEDFMFQLTQAELEEWRSQLVTSNPGAKMGLRRRPHAFTEQGVAMLSSVLRSERAVEVNIAIMRAFVRMRQLAASHDELARELRSLDRKTEARFRAVFTAIRQLIEKSSPIPARRRIGFDSESGGD